jgi:anti-anti-sigma factor
MHDPLVRQDEQGIQHFMGELSIHNLERLRAVLLNIPETRDEVALSFASVRFMDTAALQLLIAFRISLPARVTWRVVDLSSELEKILTISGLRTALLGPEI